MFLKVHWHTDAQHWCGILGKLSKSSPQNVSTAAVPAAVQGYTQHHQVFVV
jgi:hypothetical protein